MIEDYPSTQDPAETALLPQLLSRTYDSKDISLPISKQPKPSELLVPRPNTFRLPSIQLLYLGFWLIRNQEMKKIAFTCRAFVKLPLVHVSQLELKSSLSFEKLS